MGQMDPGRGGAWVVVLVAVAGCTQQPPGPRSEAVEVVRAQMDAFNRHDPAALAAAVSEDFRWLSVEDDRMRLEASGPEALAEAMAGDFEAFPDVAGVVEESTVVGNLVAVRERVRWTTDAGEERSQVAAAVYEVRDGLIRRVWYFPAQ